jgi:NAD(P)-dependent dehydrogenase (short-subunit alcohol dehydrogenase family)
LKITKEINMAIVNFSLKGKVALITGGSRGIGRAIALAFAEAGAKVAISARKFPDLEAVAKEITAMGGECLPIASRVAKVEECKSLVEQVKAKFGRIDILVNNAGTNPYPGPIVDAEEWAWDTTMNVNLKGPFILSQLVARMMKEQGGGSIINISSVAGLRPGGLPIYSVSKAGLIMLTQVMSRELGQYKIRVNAIAPGVIMTRLSEMLWKDPKATDTAIKRNTVARLGKPEDIAAAALYLASDSAGYVTGITLSVDGGER